MSSSPELAGQKPAAGMYAAEKPSFSHKCSMLSHYLKEKGNFGDLTLGIMTSATDAHSSGNELLRHSPTAAAMTLFPLGSGHAGGSNQMVCPPPPPTSHHQPMNLFPQQAGFYDSPKQPEPSANKHAPAATSQLTIFYGGQVILFNDFPAEKAEEVMLMASRGSCKSPTSDVDSPPSAKSHPTFFPQYSSAKSPITCTTATSVASPVSPGSGIVTSFANSMIQESIQVQQPPKPIVCDLPIARRASLHRFLEKRKDRITTRAPYHTSNGSAQGGHTPESKLGPTESNSWLGLVSQSPPTTNC